MTYILLKRQLQVRWCFPQGPQQASGVEVDVHIAECKCASPSEERVAECKCAWPSARSTRCKIFCGPERSEEQVGCHESPELLAARAALGGANLRLQDRLRGLGQPVPVDECRRDRHEAPPAADALQLPRSARPVGPQNFRRCAPVFYAILVILHTCILRDARAMRERERYIEKKREKNAKNRENREKMLKNQ